jgi:hypothetical protein
MSPQDAETLARQLMAKHRLTRWEFRFDRAVQRFGCCNHLDRRITLSLALTLVNDRARVRDTILHEIAHALVGTGYGHGPFWRKKARQIGAKPEPCYDDTAVNPARRQETQTMQTAWM